MLLLSRKPGEAIVFPGLGITVNVTRSSARTATIGIDAPPEIRILRKELFNGAVEKAIDFPSFEQAFGNVQREVHQLRNHLNTLNLGLQLYRQQMNAGLKEAADRTFSKVIHQLDCIEQHFGKRSEAIDAQMENPNLQSSVKLLLVEDDPDQRELLAGILSMRGCVVDCVASGNAAISYLDTNESPDYVLLDMQMADGDGASTIRQLRQCEASKNIRIVATSGKPPCDYGIAEGPNGFDRWFAKPLNTDGLLQYIQSDDNSIKPLAC
ncbi:response regulator [Rhodopirellula europaea]|uniref:response regulator n=1 Tax=Rhodopirellula europaea TaxID=1263866 RepID=UPI000349EFC1|nr:response regulator [Rhodopirellula europaea]